MWASRKKFKNKVLYCFLDCYLVWYVHRLLPKTAHHSTSGSFSFLWNSRTVHNVHQEFIAFVMTTIFITTTFIMDITAIFVLNLFTYVPRLILYFPQRRYLEISMALMIMHLTDPMAVGSIPGRGSEIFHAAKEVKHAKYFSEGM